MALLRSDIINNDLIVSAIRSLEKTRHVEVESLTTGIPVLGLVEEVLRIKVKAIVRGQEKDYYWTAKISSSDGVVSTAGERMGIWQKETSFYRAVFPFFDLKGESLGLEGPLHPTLIFSQLTPEKECLLFSDMTCEGFQPVNYPLDKESVDLAINYLAKLHALGHSYLQSGVNNQWLVDELSYAEHIDPSLLGKMKQAEANQIDHSKGMKLEYATRLRALFSTEAYVLLCKQVFGPRKDIFATVCHGRPTFSNMLQWKKNKADCEAENDGTDDTAEAIFINFSEARFCQPATDLAVLLYTSTDRQFRKQYLSECLKTYHTSLEDNLLQLGFPPNLYTFYHLYEDYQDAVVPAVGVAVNLLPGVLGAATNPRGEDQTDGVDDSFLADDVLEMLCDFGEELEQMEKLTVVKK